MTFRVLKRARRASKFGNKKTMCLSKHKHDSKMEANYCNRLLAQKQKKEIYDYVCQVRYPLFVLGRQICFHIVDFIVYPGKSALFPEVHEVKGCETDAWRIKHELFQACYPTIPYKVIKTAKKRRTWTSRSTKAI